MKKIHSCRAGHNARRIVFIIFFTVFISASVSTQPVIVPYVPAGAITIDGSKTGDWETFASLTINYNDASGDFSTQFVTDGTYLYFYTEVITSLSSPQNQTFFIGIGPASPYMLQVEPFQASDTYPLSDNNSYNITTKLLPGSWETWTGPVPLNTDFHRVLANIPERWMLEGRIILSNINISDRNSFDLFLHINTGTVQRYWPVQAAGYVDIATPSALTFNKIRNPEITLSAPFVNFGKVILSSTLQKSFVISNNGVPESVLSIESITTPVAPFSIVSVTKGALNVPAPYNLSLNQGEEATVTVRYQPISGTTIDNPHLGSLIVNNTDPDPARRSLLIPLGGNGRNFIDVTFILDQSGSMLPDKWAKTKWATEIAVETMRIFKLSQDRAGAVGFGGTSGDPRSYVLKNLNFLGAPGSGRYTDFSDADYYYWTPIGLGIQEAHNLFGSAANRRNIGVLMSDGLHNRPVGTDGATTVAGLALPANVTGNTKNMEIHTIALGSDAGVSTALLNDIKNHYKQPGITTIPPTYNITENPQLLAEKFIGAIMDPFVVNQIAALTGTAFDFPIEVKAHKVLAMIAWEQGTTPLDIRIEVFREDGTTPTGTVYNNSTSGYYKGSSADQPFTYVFIDVQQNENTVWKIRDNSGFSLDPKLAIPIVLIDLNVNAVFYVDQEINGTGQDIILKARLSEVGRPIINKSENPVEVVVQIAKPEEGFGTYVATHTPENCKPAKPTLPPVDPKNGDLKRPRDVLTNIRQDYDVPPPRFVKIDYLFDLCNKTGLDRSELPAMKLYDDGTNGDEIADDGIYTLRFRNTDYEGSYVFRFIARGTTATGARFSRTRTISRYVRVDVDPSASNTGYREYQRVDNIVTREYYVIPRDRFGGYLGPGYPDQVEFKTTAGTFISPVNDYNNGIYAQLLRYDEKTERPVVTPVVQDKFFRPIRLKAFELVLPFAGVFRFDNALSLDNGIVAGARFGYRLNNQLTLEAEGGITFAKSVNGDSGKVIQAMASLRYDINQFGTGRWLPYVTAGGGYVFFRDFGLDDKAYALQGGLGATMKFTNSFGVRIDGRYFHIDSVMGAGNTTNIQVTGGLVFWL